MSKPITQTEADEICAFCKTHPNCRIQVEDDQSWCISISNGQDYRGWMHPRSFLDMIREEHGTDILKST